jgi:hypothetical protein
MTLDSLAIHGGLSSAARQSCSSLIALQALHLESGAGSSCWPGSWDGMLPILLEHAQQLTSLSISSGSFIPSPNWLAGNVGLRKLTLSIYKHAIMLDWSCLSSEMAGRPACCRLNNAVHCRHTSTHMLDMLVVLPWVGVEELELSGDAFSCLPPVLASATSMRRLILKSSSKLRFMHEDVDRILVPMTRLRHFSMDWTKMELPAVMLHLFKRMPQLAAPNSW